MGISHTKTGWKIGEVAFDGVSPHLRSGIYGIRTAVEDIAMCFEHLEHSAPEVNCSCGFYASTRPEPLILHARAPYSQLFEVELGGRVLAARESSRSETQRMLRVHVNATCYRCRRPAEFLCTDPARDPSTHAPKLSDALIASCAICSTERAWRLADLAAEIGVELQWSRPELTIIVLGASSFH